MREKDAKPVTYNRVDWWDHPPGIDVVVGKRYQYKINSSVDYVLPNCGTLQFHAIESRAWVNFMPE